MRLNVHAHVLALDGVYVRDGPEGALAFHALPAPTRIEVTEVARRTAAQFLITRLRGTALWAVPCTGRSSKKPSGLQSRRFAFSKRRSMHSERSTTTNVKG